jgi:hypothetical protein
MTATALVVESVPSMVLRSPLRVGAVDDPLEVEAERVADRVMRTPSSEMVVRRCPGGCPDEEVLRRQPVEEEDELLRTPAEGGAPGVVSGVALGSGGGGGLPSGSLRFFEPRLGVDLSGVRVHHDGGAARLAASVNARAFTVGRDVFFGAGEWAPGTARGDRLLAHELTHTLQQRDTAQLVQRQDLGEMAARGADWASRTADEIKELAERGINWADRQVETIESAGERALEAGSELGAKAAERAEGWWYSGTGAVNRMDFDGFTLTLSGSVSYAAPAVSGLKANNPKAGGQDWTHPDHQWEPNKGPIPEGEYYVEPAEVETTGFDPAGWGHFRTRLHASMLTTAQIRLTSDREGGFFVHKDGGNNGTAGCIGIESDADNKVVHGYIGTNGARIPVFVDYPVIARAT